MIKSFFSAIQLFNINGYIQNYMDNFKSGFVAIAGAPNVGKSTLLNKMLGTKISITSKKPQTTRNRILGIVHRPFAQLVFIDTPGIHRSKSTLNIRIVDIAISALSDADVILFIVDVTKEDLESEKMVIAKLKKQNKSVILAFNKIDLVKKKILLEMINQWKQLFSFEAIIPVSAKHNIQIDELFAAIEHCLPYGPPYFPEENFTDLPERFIVAEMIREKVFRLTGQEVPYSTAVNIDSFYVKQKGKVKVIHATIHVERNSQKGIVIGKQGSKLKKIGEEARKEIEKIVDAKVFLKLFVRVQKNWSRDTKALERFGY